VRHNLERSLYCGAVCLCSEEKEDVSGRAPQQVFAAHGDCDVGEELRTGRGAEESGDEAFDVAEGDFEVCAAPVHRSKLGAQFLVGLGDADVAEFPGAFGTLFGSSDIVIYLVADLWGQIEEGEGAAGCCELRYMRTFGDAFLDNGGHVCRLRC
jgi:hypothetical protein